MIKRTRRVTDVRRTEIPFTSSETEAIVKRAAARGQCEALCESIQFSPTVLSNIRRILMFGGTVVTDTNVLAERLESRFPEGSCVRVRCYIDDAEVVNRAESMKTTRAEVALDLALTLPGSKLLVIGSAPAALKRMLIHRRREPLVDVSVLSTVNNFAGAVALKEKLRESDMAYIVTRGKNGGTGAAADILESILDELAVKP